MKDDVTEFMMNPLSGEIKTVAELDYERGEPRLVVGTEQAMLAGTLTDTSTATVILSVSDPGSPSLQTRVEMRVVVEQVVTLPSNTMDSHAINIQDARLLMRAEIFLKIFPSVKLEISRLDLIMGDTWVLSLLSFSPNYPGEVVITVTDINDNSPQPDLLLLPGRYSRVRHGPLSE